MYLPPVKEVFTPLCFHQSIWIQAFYTSPFLSLRINHSLPFAGTAELIATEGEAPTVPAGFEVLYVLTSGNGMVIAAVNETPEFEVRDCRTITYLSSLVLLHANYVKKPHRSPTMVTFFALLAHKITSAIHATYYSAIPKRRRRLPHPHAGVRPQHARPEHRRVWRDDRF